MRTCIRCALVAIGLAVPFVHADRPQDNWYHETTWSKTMAVTNGGLTVPFGVAIGPNGRVYVGDQGAQRVQVYQPDGAFLFSITNGFGGGQGFNKPRGMITDDFGNLYVTDFASNCVYVFATNGSFVRKIGNGTGSSTGQLSGAIDVAIAPSGQVFVLENINARVSVFNPDGTFVKILVGPGSLSGQLTSPVSLAVSESGRMFICQDYSSYNGNQALNSDFRSVRVFDLNGIYLYGLDLAIQSGAVYYGPNSVRVDRSGLFHVVNSVCGLYFTTVFDFSTTGYVPFERVYTLDGSLVFENSLETMGVFTNNALAWPCSAVGHDGTTMVCDKVNRAIQIHRRAFRDQWVPPRNAIPHPTTLSVVQRPQSQYVDIDYKVTDMDDTNVHTAVLAFKNGIQTISNCLRNLTLVEGTATNLGPGIAANVPHRLTWNAGADWGVSLANYKVAILAKDSRTHLLDVHYLHLPAGNSMPALTISRSPLTSNDYMQVWWWLLATNDTAIALSTNRIVGVGGAYDTQILCDGVFTTPNGRAYVHQKLNVREATTGEVTWARQAALPGNTNRWPSINVKGRPLSVNEYGFDTGDWGTNAFWVVPLD